MTTLDWLIVILLNGSIILYTLFRARDTKTSSDWFLAGRTLPWWIVGLSLYATAIDASDLVADAGVTYRKGLSVLLVNWVGVVCGWFLMVHFIAIRMYRAGMYTNAEYLEARFGPAARATSVIVQVLYRTTVLGIMSNSLFLTLSVVCGWSTGSAWSAVVLLAAIATAYTMVGGLRSVALTDALQSIIMILASIVLFVVVWQAVDGWEGIRTSIQKEDPAAAEQLLHIGADRVEREDVSDLSQGEVDAKLRYGGSYDATLKAIEHRIPGWLVCVSLIILGLAYSVVNHTQSMRMFGARSEWDLKMSIVVAGVAMLAASFLNLTMGVIGRALFPTRDSLGVPPELAADAVFPALVRDYATLGIKGIVVAGILAATLSTYDSIGSTLSALFTRDVYGRLLVRDRDDRHYLLVGRWTTPFVIFGSFVYIPFLKEGMFEFYVEVVGAFVMPLFVVYLVGTLTRAHRSSGAIGIIVGFGYGTWALVARWLAGNGGALILPPALLTPEATVLASVVVTAATMLLVSLARGLEPKGELLHAETSGWLRESQLQAQRVDVGAEPERSSTLPLVLGVVIVLIALYLSFWVFW